MRVLLLWQLQDWGSLLSVRGCAFVCLSLWLDLFHYFYWTLLSLGSSSATVRNSISIGSQVLSGSNLLAAGLQATMSLRQSVTIYFMDCKPLHITVKTKWSVCPVLPQSMCCHRRLVESKSVLSYFYSRGRSDHIWQQGVNVRAGNHMLFCAWQKPSACSEFAGLPDAARWHVSLEDTHMGRQDLRIVTNVEDLP